MSCQQAPRFITTTTNTNNINIFNNTNIISKNSSRSGNSSGIINAEDPYVFTESVPTTPPILFNIQKSRPRLSEAVSGTAISLENIRQQKVSLTNGKIAEISTHASATATPTLKNVITQSLATTAATIQNKIPTNVCIVRPQLQQQHVISSNQCLERELKSISPPPLYTPTPSLWQTPLLIETARPKPITTPALSSATPLPPTPTLTATLGGNASSQPLGGGGNSSTLTTTTTAMAKVAPIVVHSVAPPSPPASCLPPSKFHNHTLAQHLQKVECLKKPKKSVQPLEATSPSTQPISDDLEKSHCIDKSCLEEMVKEAKSAKHSANEELNEIPVNVIFRMALVPQQHQNQQQMETGNTKLNNEHLSTPAVKSHSTAVSSSSLMSSSPAELSVDRNVTTATTTSPASKTKHFVRNQLEINPSSKQRQQPALPLQQTKASDNIEHSQSLPKSKVTNSKSRKSTSTKAVYASANSFDHFTIGCSTPKGSVAIVKMSHRVTEAVECDISDLATPTGLPYCIQTRWPTPYDIRNRIVAGEKGKLNRSSLREERITLYKQQLRRQAMQLFNTKSLQRLPLQLARRRLVCVDSLLRKYHKQNERGLPASVKRCSFNNCEAYSLEMASYCQQHIALNAGQAIFLACTAKFADNTQCRVPVFDITHDLPLCLEHARKRDAYNRFLYEQKPRKMQTPAGLATPSVFSSKPEGKAIKTKQQQKLPAAGSKRATVTDQQQHVQVRKRKSTGNPVGRPQKRPKKSIEVSHALAMPCLTSTGLKRKNSTTSLESLASNSQHSTSSSTSHFTSHQQFYSLTSATSGTNGSAALATLPPPALAPLSTGFMTHSIPQHLFSFGHDNYVSANANVKKHSTATINTSTNLLPTTTEFNNFVSSAVNVSNNSASTTSSLSTHVTLESNDSNFINTNSNSNFTSSGMGSTTSLPTADDFLTQDMLSMCENSSVSSVDTGLGGLSDPELMLGGADGDDIPLGDTHLLEEQDLANVLSSLPEDAFKELFSTVHQDESDEIERAIELADKHLKTLQQTFGTDLGDFLDFNDDMLLDNTDICSSATTAPTITNHMMDTTSMYTAGGGGGVAGLPAAMMMTNGNISGGVMANNSTDVRGLVQT